MSRIKDFLAEVEEIEDLMPLKTADKGDQMTDSRIDTIRAEILDILSKNMHSTLATLDNVATYGYDDEGHTVMTNYGDFCETVATLALEDVILSKALDVSDNDYKKIITLSCGDVARLFNKDRERLIEESEEDQEEKRYRMSHEAIGK